MKAFNFYLGWAGEERKSVNRKPIGVVLAESSDEAAQKVAERFKGIVIPDEPTYPQKLVKGKFLGCSVTFFIKKQPFYNDENPTLPLIIS